MKNYLLAQNVLKKSHMMTLNSNGTENWNSIDINTTSNTNGVILTLCNTQHPVFSAFGASHI